MIKIDGVLTKQYTTLDAIKKLRGEKGTKVKITVLRGKEELIDLEIIREVIQVDSVRVRMLGGGIGYVRISQFIRNSAEDLINSLNQLKETGIGIQGLIIDLRNNPGGLLNQAIGVVDLFVKNGVIVSQKGRDASDEEKFEASKFGTKTDLPLVVLVNEGSASASEIVSGALQDHKRAILVGEKTFGKGSVQAVLPIDNEKTENIGARRLYTVMERLLEVVSFEATDKSGETVLIDKTYVNKHLGKLIEDEDLTRYIL